MPITPDHVGRKFPHAAPYEVSRAKIVEFAKAIGSQHPSYFSDDPVAPPTFATIIAAQAWDALFDDEELGLSLNRTIHTDQQFDFHRALKPGDVVVAELEIERVRNRGNLDMVTVLVNLLVGDETVCEARSTLMHTREEA